MSTLLGAWALTVVVGMPDEAAELEALRSGLRSKEPERRIEALERAANFNAAREKGASSKITNAIASALDDDELGVRAAAAGWLAKDQDPEAAVKVLSKSIPEVAKVLGQIKSKHPDSRVAMEFSVALVQAAGSYRDDRVAKALQGLVIRSPSSIYGKAVESVVDALAAFGDRRSIDALSRYYVLMEGLGMARASLSRRIHDRLTELAERTELADPPAWSDEDSMSGTWSDWCKKNARKLPAKLGKVEKAEPGPGDR